MCDKDGKPLGASFDAAGKVLSTEKTRLEVRLSQSRGTFEGYVFKTDVVKLADAPAFYTNLILRGREVRMGLANAGRSEVAERGTRQRH